MGTIAPTAEVVDALLDGLEDEPRGNGEYDHNEYCDRARSDVAYPAQIWIGLACVDK